MQDRDALLRRHALARSSARRLGAAPGGRERGGDPLRRGRGRRAGAPQVDRHGSCRAPPARTPRAAPTRRVGTISPVSSASGDELVGTEQAALGVVPAHERLDARDAPVGELDDRLVVQRELAAVERAAQLALGARRSARAPRMRASKSSKPPRPRVLGAVHRRVGVAQQVARRASSLPDERDADARRDEEPRSPATWNGAPARRARARRARAGSRRRRRPRSRIGELVAAEARDGVAGARPPRCSAAATSREQLVAGVVAERVVDELEAVEVEEEHARRCAVPRAARRSACSRRSSNRARGSAGRVSASCIARCSRSSSFACGRSRRATPRPAGRIAGARKARLNHTTSPSSARRTERGSARRPGLRAAPRALPRAAGALGSTCANPGSPISDSREQPSRRRAAAEAYSYVPSGACREIRSAAWRPRA